PIVVAALGPKNVEMAAELAEGWEPIFYFPEKADVAWGEPLAAAAAKRDPSLPPLDTIARAGLASRRGQGPAQSCRLRGAECRRRVRRIDSRAGSGAQRCNDGRCRRTDRRAAAGIPRFSGRQ